MNLHALVSPAIGVVNPPYVGSVVTSTGYTTAPDGGRTPTTSTVSGVSMQVQALSARQIEHLDGLNIQGTLRAVYLNGRVQGLNRPAAKGGDILLIPTGLSGSTPDRWLVVEVTEGWDADGWCKVAAQLQMPA